MGRLAPTLGFGIKVVGRTGAALKNMFSLTTPWEDAGCERDECTTCLRGAEMLTPCKNICRACTEVGANKDLKQVRSDISTLYVGETSRLVVEQHNTEELRGLEEQKITKLREQIDKNREEWGSRKHWRRSVSFGKR